MFLQQHGQEVTEAVADADTDIMRQAILVTHIYTFNILNNFFFKAAELGTTEVVTDDTDVAVMLLYHWHLNLHDVIFSSDRSHKSWSISECIKKLSPKIKYMILFIHAFTGCDITSSIFGLGKPSVLKQFKGGYKKHILFNCEEMILFG